VRAIISQDIAWFDANNPSTLATKVAVLINKARIHLKNMLQFSMPPSDVDFWIS
jgi:hypothetical protein